LPIAGNLLKVDAGVAQSSRRRDSDDEGVTRQCGPWRMANQEAPSPSPVAIADANNHVHDVLLLTSGFYRTSHNGSKDSYYHVYVTLSEADDRFDHAYALPLRVAHAFVWALAWWCGLALTLFVLAGTVLSIRALWSRPLPPRPSESPSV
jgi:hypothetical protein